MFRQGSHASSRIPAMKDTQIHIASDRARITRERAGFDGELGNAAKVLANPLTQQAGAARERVNRSPLARGIRQAFMYYGVSIMQTFVEFGVFALAQLALPTGVANGIAVACSGSFNFFMNRTSRSRRRVTSGVAWPCSSPCTFGTSCSAPGS